MKDVVQCVNPAFCVKKGVVEGDSGRTVPGIEDRNKKSWKEHHSGEVEGREESI